MEKMSRHPLPINPSFLPPATHGVLKSLLENPMKLPLHHEGEVRTQTVAQLRLLRTHKLRIFCLRVSRP